MRKKITPAHEWTSEQKRFVLDNYQGTTYKDLRKMVNEHFELSLTLHQIKGYMARNGLQNGLDGRFKPGQEPYNKGKKGVGGWEPTQFKKGNTPANYRPVGSERVNVDGYVEVKVKDPNKWRLKHRVVWGEHNGPIPRGHAVIFGDGDRSNFDLDNLILVTRNQLLRLNQQGLIQRDTELTRVGLSIVTLQEKVTERERK